MLFDIAAETLNLLIDESIRKNLWEVQKALIVFELVSGLSVNFHKSCLIGLNVRQNWIQSMSNELYCRMSELPFTYVGIQDSKLEEAKYHSSIPMGTGY